MYGSHTFVPVGCTCKKQTVVSHSRTEAEIVSWDAGLFSDGTPAARQRCCACHLHHKQAMNAPYRVRQFFKTVLQQEYHFKVDVIVGDASAAAYRYYRRQEYQDPHNSSVAIMLREMQREVNTGRPFKCRLHIYHSTNNHSSQLNTAGNLVLLLHGYSLMEKAGWTQNYEKTLEELAWER